MTRKKVEKVIAEKPKKNGRPTKYSEALGEEICNALGNSVDGITRICKANPHFPEPETIRDWRHKNQSFSAKYEAAKLKQALGFAEGIIDIVDGINRCFAQRQRFIADNISGSFGIFPKLFIA